MEQEQSLSGADGLKFFRLELENFKNLSKKVVEIGNRSLLFIGGNGTGKSTLIDALTSPLDVKTRPGKPIKKGETHASVIVTLAGSIGGAPKEYICELYFSPKNETGRLVVTDIDGTKIGNPATFIKSLIGNVSQDVTEWMFMEKKKKLEKIKEISGIGKQVDIANKAITDKKEERKKLKEKTEELEAVMKNHGFTKEEIDTYSVPMDIDPLQGELDSVEQSQQKFDEAINKLKTFKADFSRIEKEKSDTKEKIEYLEKQLQEEKDKLSALRDKSTEIALKIDKGDVWAGKAVRPSSSDIITRMEAVHAHNRKYETVMSFAEKQKTILINKKSIEDMDVAIKKDEASVRQMIKDSQLPIEGMEFDENNIYIDGIPLEDGGVNTAEQIKVGVEMAIYTAKKSRLKAIFIKDASMFDKHSLHNTVARIEDAGMQAIIELVDFDGGNLEVKFTEEFLT